MRHPLFRNTDLIPGLGVSANARRTVVFSEKLPNPRISIRSPLAKASDNRIENQPLTAKSASFATSCGNRSATARSDLACHALTLLRLFSLAFQQSTKVGRSRVDRCCLQRISASLRAARSDPWPDRQIDWNGSCDHIDDHRFDSITSL